MQIHPDNIGSAETKLRNLGLKEKEHLLDQLYREQPHMLASVVVLQQFGVSLQKMDFAVHVLLLIYLSMLESDGTWPVISEDVQDANYRRLGAAIAATEDAALAAVDSAILEHAKGHSELVLYHAVTRRMNIWLNEIDAEDSDKYVILCVLNLVECTARPTITKGTV